MFRKGVSWVFQQLLTVLCVSFSFSQFLKCEAVILAFRVTMASTGRQSGVFSDCLDSRPFFGSALYYISSYMRSES